MKAGSATETSTETPPSSRMPVGSPPQSGPIVTLVDYTRVPFDLSIATARTCYSGKGIITPEMVSATPRAVEIRDRVAASTLKAGHLTTRQHPHFIFTIERVSRHLVWSFLHSHPYYNSEQVSQRYVEVKPEQFHVPDSLENRPEAKEVYMRAVRNAVADYQSLTEQLMPVAGREFFKVFPGRASKAENWEKTIKKKAMEAARYVLPTATYCFLYHTVNGLTLHRYRRLCRTFDVPVETEQLVERMFEAIRRVDPLYAEEMPDSLPLEETLEYTVFEQFYGTDHRGEIKWNKDTAREFVREFDDELQDAEIGELRSRLRGYSEDAVANLAASVRAVLGLPRASFSDTDAVDLVLNPARNNHFQSTLNETTLSKITRSLHNVQYTFQKKISHTADSQDQRHRLVPGARPVLMSHYTGEPDYITPAIMDVEAPVRTYYDEAMARLFQDIESFLGAGGTMEEAAYLLPNAFPIRFYESGDLLNLHHKWKVRTCYNAQEEIFQASVDELRQVARKHPEIAGQIKAPCWIRKQAGIKPFCPEGDKYCGVPVWKLELDEYKRVI